MKARVKQGVLWNDVRSADQIFSKFEWQPVMPGTEAEILANEYLETDTMDELPAETPVKMVVPHKGRGKTL